MHRALAALIIAASFAGASVSAAKANTLRDAASKITESASVALLSSGMTVARCVLTKLSPGTGTC